MEALREYFARLEKRTLYFKPGKKIDKSKRGIGREYGVAINPDGLSFLEEFRKPVEFFSRLLGTKITEQDIYDFMRVIDHDDSLFIFNQLSPSSKPPPLAPFNPTSAPSIPSKQHSAWSNLRERIEESAKKDPPYITHSIPSISMSSNTTCEIIGTGQELSSILSSLFPSELPSELSTELSQKLSHKLSNKLPREFEIVLEVSK